MYEDAEIECSAFRGLRRIFCIASAADTAIHLSLAHEVVACDINPVQLEYAERRVKGAPPVEGDAERVMGFLRTFIPLVGWRMALVREFLAFSNVKAQSAYWSERLDTRRFRGVFDLMMSRPMLRAFYSRQLLRSLPPGFGAIVRARMARGFAVHANASNPYAALLLLGESPKLVRADAPHVRFVLNDAASYLESCAPEYFDGFALSNILDGATPAYRERMLRAVRRGATGAGVVVLRSFGEPGKDLPKNFADRDRSLLWGVVDVRRASEF